MKQTILITGGAGYIGSHTTKKMLDYGFNVIVVDDLSTGFREAVDNRAEFYQLDVTNKTEFSALLSELQVDAVLHCAGKIIVKESMEQPFDYYNANVLGLQMVLEALVENSIKNIMFSSTASIYGNNCIHSPATENTPTSPVNPYAETKLAGEKLIHWVANRYGMKYVIYRYFNVAGAELDASNGLAMLNPTHIIPNANKTILGQNKELLIFGNDYDTKDGTCIRDYIHVLDLANAHTLGMQYLLSGNDSNLFNLGTEKGYSVLEIAQKVESVTKQTLNYRFVERRNGDPANVLANCIKAKEILGWQPQYSLEQIIKSDYEWRLKHKYSPFFSKNL
ncbi:UDP-glucose 4-epimerase GalE [Bacillus thuringiensis]|uniref:UDP-glucose 4-epimerase GalE n=1 Tax=Bacillus thuringiensis TaxID=1428 RepID=UPI002541E7DD|nr:UDP-glucose 4-epimerase GalE [Bacillus thuringiensis]WIG15501.1 UDP-glucose 4-epimerase GalE [Bacillus thuringiensis]